MSNLKSVLLEVVSKSDHVSKSGWQYGLVGRSIFGIIFDDVQYRNLQEVNWIFENGNRRVIEHHCKR